MCSLVSPVIVAQCVLLAALPVSADVLSIDNLTRNSGVTSPRAAMISSGRDISMMIFADTTAALITPAEPVTGSFSGPAIIDLLEPAFFEAAPPPMSRPMFAIDGVWDGVAPAPPLTNIVPVGSGPLLGPSSPWIGGGRGDENPAGMPLVPLPPAAFAGAIGLALAGRIVAVRRRSMQGHP